MHKFTRRIRQTNIINGRKQGKMKEEEDMI
jgi:hypothetical protein